MQKNDTWKLRRITTALLGFSTLAFASDANAAGSESDSPAIQREPGASAFVEELNQSLPSYWSVKEAGVTAKANRGDAVDPRWVYRLRFSLSPTEDLYTSGESKGNVTFLKPAEKQDSQKTLYARGQATFDQGDWSLEFTKVDSPMSDGRPSGAFPGRTLVAGSEAAQRFKDKRMQDALADYRRDLDAQHKRLEARLDKQIADLKDQQAAELEELNAEHEQDIAELKTEHANRLERLRTEIAQTREQQRLMRRLATARQELAKVERDAHQHLRDNVQARAKLVNDLVTAIKSDAVPDALATFETVRSEAAWMAVPVVTAGLQHRSVEVQRAAVKLAYDKGDIYTQRRALSTVVSGRWTGHVNCSAEGWHWDVTWTASADSGNPAGNFRATEDTGDTHEWQMVVSRIVDVGTEAPLMTAETLHEDAFDYHLRYDPNANAIVGRSQGKYNCTIRMTRSGGGDATTGEAAGLETHTVLIIGEKNSGRADYTLNGGGLISPIDDERIDGYDITFNHGDDRVRGRIATGWVGNGNDGYRVHGAVPDIDLDNPSNARVVVDGEPLNTSD